MKTATAEIRAGICGFFTHVRAEGDDDYQVQLAVESDCEKVQAFAVDLATLTPVNALDEIMQGAEGVVLGTSRNHLKGCCAACVSADGVFKAMQVAAGLALPADVHIGLELEA